MNLKRDLWLPRSLSTRGLALAQAWPPSRAAHGFLRPGGVPTHCTLGRAAARRIARQSVVVENRPGAAVFTARNVAGRRLRLHLLMFVDGKPMMPRLSMDCSTIRLRASRR